MPNARRSNMIMSWSSSPKSISVEFIYLKIKRNISLCMYCEFLNFSICSIIRLIFCYNIIIICFIIKLQSQVCNKTLEYSVVKFVLRYCFFSKNILFIYKHVKSFLSRDTSISNHLKIHVFFLYKKPVKGHSTESFLIFL